MLSAYTLIRKALFQMEPETAHNLTLSLLSRFPQLAAMVTRAIPQRDMLRQSLFGMDFKHPVGLAAGLDKNAEAVDGLFHCGFSFVEVGTVTPLAQPGNPLPRLFRLVENDALINRMGFNNQGIETLLHNLRRQKRRGVLGINIGKNKVTPNEQAVEDYRLCAERALPMADYLVINISSPNTPGLRDLQSENSLVELVEAVLTVRERLAGQLSRRPPVFVKLAPDLPDESLAAIAHSAMTSGVDGIIATNTTVQRRHLAPKWQNEAGGLSGKPLEERATEAISVLYRATLGQIPIIGCGGIFTADDAYRKIRAGASLIQIYTSFIYKGPPVVGEIVEGLADRLSRDGFHSVAQAVGCDARQRALQ